MSSSRSRARKKLDRAAMTFDSSRMAMKLSSTRLSSFTASTSPIPSARRK